jgi:hypothetical protein
MAIDGSEDIVLGLKHRYEENNIEEEKLSVHVSRGRRWI